MPRYYCDYCDTYLTHDSPSVRKQHNAGYKHKANVRTYYQQFEEQQTQSLIDQRIKEHLGQAAAFQVGASFNQHLMSFQANAQRPRLPILAPPIMPGGMPPQNPMVSPLPLGVRPPVLPRPVGVPGYGAVATVPSMAPPGAASMPMQFNNLPRPPMMMPPPTVGTPTSTSNGPTSMASPVMYQVNPPAPTGGYNAYPSPASGVQSGAPAAPSPSVTSAGTNAPPSENNH